MRRFEGIENDFKFFIGVVEEAAEGHNDIDPVIGNVTACIGAEGIGDDIADITADSDVHLVNPACFCIHFRIAGGQIICINCKF